MTITKNETIVLWQYVFMIYKDNNGIGTAAIVTSKHGLYTEKTSLHLYPTILIINIGLMISPAMAYFTKLAHESATGEKPHLKKKYTNGNIIKPSVGEIRAFSFIRPFAYSAR